MPAAKGPKPSQRRARMREESAWMSDRTFGTFWRASELLRKLKFSGYITDTEVDEAAAVLQPPGKRPNVSAFARHVDALAKAKLGIAEKRESLDARRQRTRFRAAASQNPRKNVKMSPDELGYAL